MMSASPPKDLDAEAGEQDQSPDEQEQQHMDRGQQDASQQPPVFDFEVKEQDRWLPIANGEFVPGCLVLFCFVLFFSSGDPFQRLRSLSGSFISVRRFWEFPILALLPCLACRPLGLRFYFWFPSLALFPTPPRASLLGSRYIWG
jgi:hypothetical protein